MPNEAVSIDIAGAKITVATTELFRAWFDKHMPASTLAPVVTGVPKLANGERYVGTITSADGRKQHHIILLPGEVTKDWNDATAWAASIGGDLPDRVESALLFYTLRDEFQKEAYWTNETHDPKYAWCQDFLYGLQYTTRKDFKLRARAVRREPFSPFAQHGAP